ncbi:bifunctional proline dehydrogenase/L-glutamate gamma-semialdehyde dehydrogenase PutA [Tepidimonas aquatica]|uniref:Bifunctional protein PutA n=1 Tax=Tepidimonas aquatica TaxID=247482 RepID=A0A554WTS1_9BURK|nr:bifunctional proline dehydrogenase/L-glutamate gamma-semialdehyde dehydrogenase PutA [Tepidimonas aquatica]TSE26982.1 Bifunctional protein PutA [Tepidimonas aquatica]
MDTLADTAHLQPVPSPLADGPIARAPTMAALPALHRAPEPELLASLLPRARLDDTQRVRITALAQRLAAGLRERAPQAGRKGLVQALLQEYALTSHEGVALMCLAEALLRIPDAATRDALIRDKIGRGDWRAHLGHSRSLFVNAATWGLLLTGKLTATHNEAGLGAALKRVLRAGGEPLVRRSVDLAMRLLGEQFVTGQTIDEALRRAQPREAQGFRYSYDMLGEAALTAADAQRYFDAYRTAIDAIGAANAGRGPIDGPGVSIKLSALHPRYSRAQYARVMDELYPRLRALAEAARAVNIGLHIDAEEADRLELSLDLLQRLCHEPSLAGWDGIGFVIQAYQKRAPAVVDHVIALARRSGLRLLVRLVKGAYWDSEIKRAQLDGLDYPVYTRKAYTDVAYLACARALLNAPDAVFPQFATHNAQTLAAIHEMADPARWHPHQYEFQCLHGMGEPLYEQVVTPVSAGGLGRPCRIYAPVGTHETLLAYLVRRLLENGANTSFVHRIADPRVPLDALVEDPVDTVRAWARTEGALGLPHPRIPAPAALYGAARPNSTGCDLADEATLRTLSEALHASRATPVAAQALLADGRTASGTPRSVSNPGQHDDIVGHVRQAGAADAAHALALAQRAAASWAATPAPERAARLRRAADALQADLPAFVALLMREVGKTAANGVAEVREAIDFLRFYAAQITDPRWPANAKPLGPVVCISPWNFPLAIFTGQIAAALAAGNPVLAKPAEQTPLVAARMTTLLHAAGIPRDVLQLLPGEGETVGAALVADARTAGVLFTGSTEVAKHLQRTLATRVHAGADGRATPIPLVAETGGQNAMVVDSSALAEQVVQDVLTSAFDSAGQRCSALRVLCLQDDIADHVLYMLRGAMAELRIGPATRLSTDVGPVIDAAARDAIVAHIEAMRARGCRVWQAPLPPQAERGTYVAPTLIELDGLTLPEREVFGPVLHVVRWRRGELDALVAAIHATGYGLTFGVHSRIDETIDHLTQRVQAGNHYVNRNMVGAVVGVQPFGGEGLSGTGPKAGGPLLLYRLLADPPADAVQRPLAFVGADDTADWRAPVVLRGPTGQRDTYRLLPRTQVLCLANDPATAERMAHAVRALGAHPLVPDTTDPANWLSRQPTLPEAALLATAPATALAWQQALAAHPGPVVPLYAWRGEPLPAGALSERSLSVNTAAAGGNASLMSLD